MKKILMLLILFILIGCGKAELKDKKNENNSITDIDRLLGEWESIEDKFIVEIANTNKKNIYKLKFSGEDSNATDLNADDATLSNPNENLYVFKSDNKDLEYTFNFEDDENVTFLFNTIEKDITGTSKPIKMKKIIQ
ncbi:hypothetical protein [Carnobacterium sp.]|uniref:hypothetical protein n=1 Tax=Carnobacterium sp. TaxID=48221 RepID=UPI002FCB2299